MLRSCLGVAAAWPVVGAPPSAAAAGGSSGSGRSSGSVRGSGCDGGGGGGGGTSSGGGGVGGGPPSPRGVTPASAGRCWWGRVRPAPSSAVWCPPLSVAAGAAADHRGGCGRGGRTPVATAARCGDAARPCRAGGRVVGGAVRRRLRRPPLRPYPPTRPGSRRGHGRRGVPLAPQPRARRRAAAVVGREAAARAAPARCPTAPRRGAGAGPTCGGASLPCPSPPPPLPPVKKSLVMGQRRLVSFMMSYRALCSSVFSGREQHGSDFIGTKTAKIVLSGAANGDS